MHPETAAHLVDAIRASGLFTPGQLAAIARDLSAHGDDLHAGMRHLLRRGRVTHYQLGKIVRGKAADLLVGPYVVLDKLGEGGMGKVFRARAAADARVVALKVIRPALTANPVVRGRYAREVESTGRLNHPNLVRLHDGGEAGGKFFLAMEFVDGLDLARLVRDVGPLEVAEACEYARQAALGLQHAHEHGIIHRDVKPSNVVVAGERHLPQAAEPAAVKVLDLGLARAVDPDDMVAPDLTRDHTVVGTPDYMAPEQARNSKRVDGRADLYALGCTLYFLLTGRPPFPDGSAIEKIMRHQAELPAPLQGLRPGVPAAVAVIVARLLAKRPEDRFASAAELAAELAPHARYPRGAAAVPTPPPRPSVAAHHPASSSGSGLRAPGDAPSTVPVVARADDTPVPVPRPRVTPRPPARPKGKPRGRAVPRPRRRAWVWVGVCASLCLSSLVVWMLFTLLRK